MIKIKDIRALLYSFKLERVVLCWILLNIYINSRLTALSCSYTCAFLTLSTCFVFFLVKYLIKI